MFIRWQRRRWPAPPEEGVLFWRLVLWIGVALLSGSLGALWGLLSQSTPLMQRSLTSREWQVFQRGDRWTGTRLHQPMNLLLIGSKVLTADLDEPPDSNLTYHALVNSVEGLSDSLLLVRFDPVQQRLVLLSIPRDTLTFISGRGDAKINEANALGGPVLAAETVSDLLGDVPIDRYLRINVQGIEKLIDALGGVTVDVPTAMRYRDDSQRLYIDLQPGRQHLNGNQALQFLRFRYDALGDIGRVQRQQMFLRALMEQTARPETLARTPQILSIIREHLDTNLTVEELMSLGQFLTSLPRSRVEFLMLPGTFNGTIDEVEVSYWLPDYRRIAWLTDQYFRDTPTADPRETGLSTPAQVRIAIQNTTLPESLVVHLSQQLENAGYPSPWVAEPLPQRIAITRIIAQQGDLAAARRVQLLLGFGEVRVESTGVLASDVTIQLGDDARDRLQLRPAKSL
ncbi:LCP family protein [Thermosynechococcus sp. HN-54]|uniref:LCP family protein n=1 Tax=Thermosynechococcus sp. HN-54 TaxID=2933959 RepID=UPI00202CFDFF|nr:LCP family protein [Thermosynechococcus sp. HN-54]URR34690.1 LCP family protein [Thermosynechococcus sp. HN-54]